jgi:hypothetical protein
MKDVGAIETHESEIGGYFGFDLPFRSFPFGPVTAFQSARAALHAVLRASVFRRVFIPTYICDSVIKAAENSGVTVVLYELDRDLLPLVLPDDLDPNDALIYVNYFGLSDLAVAYVIRRFGASRVLIDQSQALFSPVSGAYADIFSPRKFVGLPDGGWVRPVAVASEPDEQDEGSIDRMRHLMIRMAYSARVGYADFNSARLSLVDSRPKRMSRLTHRLLHAIDWENVARLRRRNYQRMAGILNATNARPLPLSRHSVPLCYPYTRLNVDMTIVRQELSGTYDIFSPTYWPEVSVRLRVGSIEEMLLKHTLFLPIDQRINFEQLDRLCSIVLDLLSGK